MIVNKQNSNRKICEAFYELPGSKSRLFMGCQASELNHLTKPFKMGLQLTNHRFNYDKFRVYKRLTCLAFDGSCQDYLDRSGLLDEGRLTRGFRWIHQASKPCLIAYYKGPFKLFVALHKEPPSNFVSCAQWVPMFELCIASRLSLAPWVWSSQALLWRDSRINGQDSALSAEAPMCYIF